MKTKLVITTANQTDNTEERMSNMNTTQIIEKLTAFNQVRYEKKQALDEMMQLQRQMAEFTFGEEKPDAKIWEISGFLKAQNEARHHIADGELIAFEKHAKEFANMVKAEISGMRGERYVQQRLNMLKYYHQTIGNVELNAEGIRTELDFIVITRKGICILEVKNTKKNIFISEDGGYYRTGTYMCFEYNLREKMELREKMLRSVLQDIGICNPNIYSMVVFTNNRIEIQNRCPQIHPVFLDQLPSAIWNVGGWNLYSTNNVENMAYAIQRAQIHETYAPDMDMQAFKESFASVIDTLENAAQRNVMQNEVKTRNPFSFIRHIFRKTTAADAA